LPNPATVRLTRLIPGHRAFFRYLLTALLALILSSFATANDLSLPIDPDARTARIAIVIDDVGYSLQRAEQIMDLPRELTLGMLPYAPHALEIAERAHASGREIILHQPMEPVAARRLEPGTLALDMTPERFDAQFEAALARLPNITGVNNHTGSLLTAHRLPMEQLMAGIARRGLFFLDSRTTPHTVAESTARALDVPTIRRDVFLDHVRSEAYLESAFNRSLSIARKQGQAVIIAHPYPITVAFLEEKLAALPGDVVLTTLSTLVPQQSLGGTVRRADRAGIALLGNPVSPHISLGQ
jgi:polysaccharide deacetylase 2 family uncharacterized protein YibQ